MSNVSSNLAPEAPDDTRRNLFWNPWFAIFAVIGSYLASIFVSQILLEIFLNFWASAHHETLKQALHWAQNSVSLQFGFMIISYALLLAPLYFLAQHFKVNWSEFGFKRPQPQDPLYALAILPAYYIVLGIIMLSLKALIPAFNLNQQQQIGFNTAHSAPELVMTFISLAVIPPIVEETIMRGYLYTVLRNKLHLVVAAILTSVIFAIGHLEFGSGTSLVWVAAVFTLVLSFFLIFLRQTTGRLAPAMFLHAFVNSISFFQLFIHHS